MVFGFDPPVGVGFASNQPDLDAFSNSWGLNGRYYFEPFGFIVGGGFSREYTSGVDSISASGNGLTVPMLPEESDIDRYSVSGGAYLLPQTRLSITYSNVDRSIEQRFELQIPTVIGDGFITSRTETKVEEWDLRLRRLGTLVSFDYSLTASIARESTESDFIIADFNGSQQLDSFDIDADKYSLGANIYPLKNLGIFLLYSQVDHSQAKADLYGLGTEWFINKLFAVSAQYALADLERGQQSELFAVGFKLRL